MEQFRYSDSETATTTPPKSPSQTSLSDDSSPGSAGAAVNFLRVLGDSAASIAHDTGKKNSHNLYPELSVTQSFRNATLLLTGATGYVGALVLEQLFRTCPGVEKVYVVIRGSRDREGNPVTAQQRLEKLLNGPEFLLLQDQLDHILSKIEVISGDLVQPGLGLSAVDRHSISCNTNYIIHCAASIRFDEPISTIMRTNYACTRELLELATCMPNLRCFTYMSTAYVNSNQPKHSKINEEIYPLPGTDDPFEVAKQLMELPTEKAARLAEKLMKQWGLLNTYFVAKTLSERLVMSYDNCPFPVCILRPSLIGCVAGDPFPGYIGNTSGFTGLVLGSLAGIITFVQHNPKSCIAVVPGDVVSSATLAATAATGSFPGMFSNIIHICSSDTYPLENRVVHCTGAAYLNLDPVRSPQKTLVRGQYKVKWVKSRSTFKLKCFARGTKLQALSLALRLSGNARQAEKIMMGHKIWTTLGAEDLDYDFTFKTPTTQLLYDVMSEDERKLIKPVWRQEDGDSWLRYIRTYAAGVKHLYLKEAPVETDMQDYRPRSIAAAC